MTEKVYYHAYDDRYRQIHGQNLQWFENEPSPIVAETIRDCAIRPHHKLLEIGCGEGRDARPLLEQGFDLLATDVSAEAVSYCRQKMPAYAGRFQILDCITETLDMEFDFIYAVAVVHMLVPAADRAAFYGFIHRHLKPDGTALICAMGDGVTERQSDIGTAFDMQDRVHGQSGKIVRIAGTSCRMVSFRTFDAELAQHGFDIRKQGLTAVEPDFPEMMYAVVTKR